MSETANSVAVRYRADEQIAETTLPRSVTFMWVNALALALSIAAWLVLRDNAELPKRYLALICLGVYAVVVVAVEVLVYKVHRRASTGLDYARAFSPSVPRIVIKCIGLYVTLGALAMCFFVFDLYARDFFAEPRAIVADWRYYLPALIALQLLYFVFVDGYQRKPEDAYWRIGACLLGRRGAFEAEELGQHALGWVVKGFFLPIMFVYLVNNFHSLNFSWWYRGGFFAFYDFMFTTLFTIDLLITCCGYMMTMRVFDSHIRSTEPTSLGWTVAVMCYYPFWQTLYDAYFRYEDGTYWGHMVEQSQWLVSVPVPWAPGFVEVVPWVVLWGAMNIGLIVIYTWATLAFGVRFSNLTHRGVLTNGPYRWCKHPAYVSKNLSWWMISVPFYFHDNATLADTVRHCLMLVGVNVIYIIRARTEERHLSWDPDYVAYATWMNEHGLFSVLGKRIPYFQYRPPGRLNVNPVEWS